MLLKVPFTFSAQVRLARTRSSKKLDSLLGSVPVMFAETTKEQAPIVLWMTPANVANTLQTAVRWHDDALWHPFLMNNVEGESRPETTGFFRRTGLPFGDRSRHTYTERIPSLFTPESFSTYVAAGLGPGSISGISQVFASPNGAVHDGVHIDCLKIKEIDFNEHDAKKAQIARFAADILLIDGAPHRRIQQPTIALTFVSDFNLDFAFGNAMNFSMPEEIRQIDRFQDAVEALDRINGKVTDRVLAAPEIMRPDLIKLDDELGPATRAVVEGVLIDGAQGIRHGSPLADHVPVVVKAFHSLRDAYYANAATDELMTHLEVLVGSVPRETPEDDRLRVAANRLAVLSARSAGTDPSQRLNP